MHEPSKRYDYFRKRRFADDSWRNDLSCDVFLSAFNLSERIQRVFEDIDAKRKQWVVVPQYEFSREALPSEALEIDELRESDFVVEMLDRARVSFGEQRVIVDATGFLRPQLMFLLRYAFEQGAKQLEFIYSEPRQYANREDTQFTRGTVSNVRPVQGYSGRHAASMKNVDLLIIGAGYEHRLMADVADRRKSARKVQIFGFPPLQADFYQEGVLRASKAHESMGETPRYFAPANDPFITAAVLSEIVAVERLRRSIDNIFLSPLATKAQALGFAFYFIWECRETPTSIIFPFSTSYHPSTSTGLANVWHYVFEFPER